ncbi:peptidyl-prolyl cis-trans isomerase SurA [Kordia periserrulae]|uniref:Peptidyl-prolyl cis-trans isomerase SurA n=1 Tax=Kordia periserrulae TaxID=701523 RepID=A0A2T6C476_9FLAO|nr:peptidylprolyl isomerase [Kordia periserrulae]PTX63105.1 peptidyl-prolyl cis-trans isomerase SurA [Kordia periserrulae]
MKKNIPLFLLLLVSFVSFGQSKKDKVLFTIEGEPTYVSEFSRVYKKNLDIIDKKDQKEIEEYFDLFLEYKLKLKEAEQLKLDEKDSYKKELAGYRKQLSRNYLTDEQATEKLVREAYERLQKEVKASHILIKVSQDASPEDTLKAYNAIMKIRDTIVTHGVSFSQMAVEQSDDPSAMGNKSMKGNLGNLGYFSAFRMVYPFESAAYNTKVGEVSMPVRTQFGYHIIKTEDIRDNAGEITVAHILLLDKKEGENKEDPAQKIQDIYSQIQSGADFGTLAKRFSDDRSSGVNNGQLPRFGRGRLSSKDFEEVAFSLKEPNEISKPFQSEFGWHIVKLISKHSMRSFEEEKPNLERKIKNDKRASVINSSILKKIRKLYTIEENDKAVKNDFYALADDTFFSKNWQKPTDEAFLNKTLLQIKDTKITYDEFATYLLKNRARVMTQNPAAKEFINRSYKEFVNGKLLAFYESDLENINEEFAAIYGEYRDGLLLFDLMETEIWEKAKIDTIGLETFFNANKENYKWNKRVEGVIASCSKESAAQKVQQLLKVGKSLDEIKEAINKEGNVNVIFSPGVFEDGHRNLPENFKFSTGVSDIYKDGTTDFTIIKVNEILPASYKEMSEIKGKVISDYQVYLEKEWIKRLKEKYEIDINKRTYKKLKKLVK